MQPSTTTLQMLDRLSEDNVLRLSKPSRIGIIGTIILIVVSLYLFIPPTIAYAKGLYTQSTFLTKKFIPSQYYSKDDFKFGIAIRYKKNGSYFNHTYIKNQLRASVYFSPEIYYNNGNKQDVQLCEKGDFSEDINGCDIQDCLKMPDYTMYQSKYLFHPNNYGLTRFVYSYLGLNLGAYSSQFPFIKSTTQSNFLTKSRELFADIIKNCYYQVLLSTKITTDDGSLKFKVNKIASYDFMAQHDTIGASFTTVLSTRNMIMDNSILPWKNNRNRTFLDWQGHIDNVNGTNYYQTGLNGINTIVQLQGDLISNYRYYKKLDWLFGIIAGGIFLLYLFMWVPMSYLNSGLLKIELANQLLIQKTIDRPQTQEKLLEIKIPKLYLIQRLILFCKDKKKEKILEQVQNEDDIMLLIKKMKVATRNLQKKQFLSEEFNSKIVIFKEQQLLQQQQQGQDQSQSFVSKSQEKSSRQQHEAQYKRLDDLIKAKVLSAASTIKNNGLFILNLLKSSDKKKTLTNDKKIDEVSAQNDPSNNEKLSDNVQRYNGSNKIMRRQKLHVSHNQLIDESQLQEVQERNIENRVQQFQIFNNQRMDEEQDDNEQIIEQNETMRQMNNNNSIVESQQRKRICQKFNLTTIQLDQLINNRILESYFETTPTYLILKDQSTEHFQQIMEMDNYDKWEGHFLQKKCSVKETISKIISYFDLFGAKYTFLARQHSASFIGFFSIIAILILSAFTFYTTVAYMDDIQYKVEPLYLNSKDLAFTKNTSQTFNMILCFRLNPTMLTSSSPSANLTFFIQDNGNVTQYKPIKLTTQNPLNIKSILLDNPNNLQLTYCYRFPYGIVIKMNDNSFFGYKLTPICTGTTTFCAANINSTNSRFVTALNNNRHIIVLPSFDFHPDNSSLFNTFKNNTFSTIQYMNITTRMNIEETFQIGQIQVYNDTDKSIFRSPILHDYNLNADYSSRRTRAKTISNNETKYVMNVKLGPSMNKITLKTKKINWMIGVFGGILVFWYFIIHLLAHIYSRFNFYLYLSKIVYGQQSYDEGIIFKLLSMSLWPRILIPKCFGIRRQINRVRLMDKKLENSVNHLSLIKYTDNCYRLSSTFFSSIAAKSMSLIYFRQKLDEKVYVQNQKKQTKKMIKDQDFAIYADEIEEGKQLHSNKILNDNLLNKQQQNKQIRKDNKFKPDKLNKQQMLEHNFGDYVIKDDKKECFNIENQLQDENIIQKSQTSWIDFFNAYPQQSQFFLKKNKKTVSICGGILSLIVFGIVILLVYYEIGAYFNRQQSISTNYILDAQNQGFILTTGQNFKLGINFINRTTFQPIDFAPYISTINIVLIKQEFQRYNDLTNLKIQITPLQVCKPQYLESWASKNIDSSYHQSFNYSYCIPDNINLPILGLSKDKIKKSFQISIVSKENTILGNTQLKTFLNSVHVQFHFSSSQYNSYSRSIAYDMNSEILVYFPVNSFTPMEINISLSKKHITYDDSTNWQQIKNTLTTYTYQPYIKTLMEYKYLGNPSLNAWYNVSFSYSKKVQTYYVSSPKFVEIFGIIGGITFLAILIFGCCARSFNKYKMKYEIGKELYLFDKLRIVYEKDKIKKLPRKTKLQRYQLQMVNNYSDFSLFQAYFLSFPAFIMKDFNFNKTLRRITYIQNRVSDDLSLSNFYLSLYKARQCINKQIEKQMDLNYKLTDIYFKKIVNDEPIPYTMVGLKNYAKQHKLSSHEQLVVVRAVQNGIKIRQILDKKLLEQLFNFVDEGLSINLGRLSDTYNSVQSNQLSSQHKQQPIKQQEPRQTEQKLQKPIQQELIQQQASQQKLKDGEIKMQKQKQQQQQNFQFLNNQQQQQQQQQNIQE